MGYKSPLATEFGLQILINVGIYYYISCNISIHNINNTNIFYNT